MTLLMLAEDNILKLLSYAFAVLMVLIAGLTLIKALARSMTDPEIHAACAMADRGLRHIAERLHTLARPRAPRSWAGRIALKGLGVAMGLVFLVLAAMVFVQGSIVLALAFLAQASSFPLALLGAGFFLLCCYCTRIIWLQGSDELRNALR